MLFVVMVAPLCGLAVSLSVGRVDLNMIGGRGGVGDVWEGGKGRVGKGKGREKTLTVIAKKKIYRNLYHDYFYYFYHHHYYYHGHYSCHCY